VRAPNRSTHPLGFLLILLDAPVTATVGAFRAAAEGVCRVKRMWTDRI